MYAPLNVFQGYQQPISTPCGILSLNNAFYCPLNWGVYYDEILLGGFLTAIGDAAAAFVIAHEIGHHVGITVLGWIPGQVLTPSGTVLTVKESELMADCFAGVWLANVASRGLLEAGDVEEVSLTLIRIGDPTVTWFDPTQHGTPEQRTAATNIGFGSGAGACTSQVFFDLFPTPRAES